MSAPGSGSSGTSGGGSLTSPGFGGEGDVRKVSESAFEYLVAEICAMPLPGGVGTNAKEDPGNSASNALITQRLDTIGYDVGFRFVEKVVANQKYIGVEGLDIVKFICKEFWEEVFGKKVFSKHVLRAISLLT